ncbi:MAG: hypothetical protein ACP5RX_01680 [Minisyncoccia bacterium]
MTIIHDYSKQARSIVLQSSQVYPRGYRNSPQYYLNNLNYYFGHAKTLILGLLFISSIFIGWFILFGENISLDYQISTLKQNIQKQNDVINSLNEEIASKIDNNKVLEWAKANGFTDLKSISYLNLKAENLAQAPSEINFK